MGSIKFLLHGRAFPAFRASVLLCQMLESWNHLATRPNRSGGKSLRKLFGVPLIFKVTWAFACEEETRVFVDYKSQKYTTNSVSLSPI